MPLLCLDSPYGYHDPGPDHRCRWCHQPIQSGATPLPGPGHGQPRRRRRGAERVRADKEGL